MSLTEGLHKMGNATLLVIEANVAVSTLKLQNYMRKNYKWTPHSHRANQTMTGSYEKLADGFLIALSYGVDYGVYLELAHEKKYAITHPTAKTQGKIVMQSMEDLLNNLDAINKKRKL